MPAMNAAGLTAALIEEAIRLGFDLVGATPAAAPPDFHRFQEWLAEGYAGQMHYLADRRDAYRHPAELLAGAKSLLMLGVNYRTAEPVEPTAGQARVSRYAWGADYHEVIRGRLHTLADFHRRHPAVEITIEDTGSRFMADQVRAGVLDAAFVGLFADQVPADLVHRVLAVEPLVAIVGVDDPLAGRGSVDLVELADLAGGRPFVEMRPESGLRRQVDAAFDRAGVVRTAAFELGTSDAVVRFVGLGFGAALVPLSATSGRSGVASLRLTDALAQHPVSLVHRQPEPSAPSARAFLALLTG